MSRGNPNLYHEVQFRHIGFVRTLNKTYGFLVCPDTSYRFFFHSSAYIGRFEHLKIGDHVTYYGTTDARSGKPIAFGVSKIAPEVVSNKNRLLGKVTEVSEICYESMGKVFFLTFNSQDVQENMSLFNGDTVSFELGKPS